MKLTVLIPTWRRHEELANCLDGLARQSRIPDEVMVVARAEDRETRALLDDRRRSGVLPLKPVQVESPGQVWSLKAGLAQATGDVVAITDDDAVPRPDWLERIERRFAEEPAVGGVGGRDWVHEGERVHDGSSRTVGKIRWYGRLIGNHHLGVGGARPVDLLKGVNMAFRLEALRGLSLTEGLRGGGAQVHCDMDLCLGIKSGGWHLLYDPEIAVDHYPAPRFDEDQREHRPRVALQNEVYNETYVLARRLPLRRAALPLLYALLVGTRQAPGPGVALERFTRGERPRAALLACTRVRIEALAAAVRDGKGLARPPGREGARLSSRDAPGSARLQARLRLVSTMTAKERLRSLVDDLSEEEAATALIAVERRRADPMLHALSSAPSDDEPSSPEEDDTARQALAAYERGEALSREELKRDLGIA